MIELIPIKFECKGCNDISEPESFLFVCPTCGNSDITIISGNELTISEIEFEDSLTN